MLLQRAACSRSVAVIACRCQSRLASTTRAPATLHRRRGTEQPAAGWVRKSHKQATTVGRESKAQRKAQRKRRKADSRENRRNAGGAEQTAFMDLDLVFDPREAEYAERER
eukprot:COSAG02_NODE_15345_length_1180_cov_1.030527_2_plen_110_part_01